LLLQAKRCFMTVTYKSKIKGVPWAVRRAVADGMEQAARSLVRVMRANLNTPYPPASEPGEFPHKRTGNLRDNVDYWIDRKTLKLRIGPTVDAVYGLYLEYGTSRMAARPWIAPSYASRKQQFQNTIANASRKAIRKYMR
jgi:HK97 gp10 family phage protein